MRILLVIFHADPARGGAERYTVDLAAGLAAGGHDVTLAATSFGNPIPGVIFLPLPARGWSRLGRYRAFLAALARADLSFDVIHAMLPVERCDVYHPHAGVAAQSMQTTPLNRFNRKRRAFADVERALLTDSGPMVICLSSYIRQAVRQHYPLADDRLPIIFNGVDLRRFNPAGPGETRDALRTRLGLSGTVALMIAQDFARKGLAQTIDALPRAPLASLVVVGRPRADEYQRQAQRLGVASRVIFAGPTDRPEDFYRAADFFVLPTRHDPCSLVVLEALAMGLPVISTAANGACELMRHGEHGYVLRDPDDVPALAAAMAGLCDPDRRRAMSTAAAALRPCLSQEEHIARIVALYEGIGRSRAAGQ